MTWNKYIVKTRQPALCNNFRVFTGSPSYKGSFSEWRGLQVVDDAPSNPSIGIVVLIIVPQGAPFGQAWSGRV